MKIFKKIAMKGKNIAKEKNKKDDERKEEPVFFLRSSQFHAFSIQLHIAYIFYRYIYEN